jgi:hypothetical protein
MNCRPAVRASENTDAWYKSSSKTFMQLNTGLTHGSTACIANSTNAVCQACLQASCDTMASDTRARQPRHASAPNTIARGQHGSLGVPSPAPAPRRSTPAPVPHRVQPQREEVEGVSPAVRGANSGCSECRRGHRHQRASAARCSAPAGYLSRSRRTPSSSAAAVLFAASTGR